MRWSIQFVLTCLCATVLLATGCASVYRSPGAEDKPVAELATLVISSYHASVRKVDGKLMIPGNMKKFEFLPGVRTLNVYLTSGYTFNAEITMQFEAKAGVQYELKALHNDNKWRWESWIVKEGSEIPVSEQLKIQKLGPGF